MDRAVLLFQRQLRHSACVRETHDEVSSTVAFRGHVEEARRAAHLEAQQQFQMALIQREVMRLGRSSGSYVGSAIPSQSFS